MVSELRERIVRDFGISRPEADRLIERAQVKSHIRSQVAAAQQGVRAAPEIDLTRDVNAWRNELRKRMTAMEILRDGVGFVEKLVEQLQSVLEKERQLVEDKAKTINDRSVDWWNFRESGWAAGGREMFAHLVHDILSNLDEAGLGSSVMKKLGFKRTIPMPDLVDLPPIQTAADLESRLVGAGHFEPFDAGELKTVQNEIKKLRPEYLSVLKTAVNKQALTSQEKRLAANAAVRDLIEDLQYIPPEQLKKLGLV